ncbi:MAG: glutamine synthetase [Elusimicrobia bacterium GWA2_61_42]|nr:MAG: glutamine synthetase [Elusimicrobia bacterium GWA2_61_42]OGR77772.1 MAG: glutamine synthetase [Elusimicrobia bacterium GWC2_61_25]
MKTVPECGTPLKNFLEIPYDELEALNLEAAAAAEKLSAAELEKKYCAYLQEEKRLKAVTVCFTDIEGRFHMLDYDKQHFLRANDNLTFDGSSIRGFSAQKESDLRLGIDWGSIFWLPSDVFGPGKVIMFCTVLGRDKTPYESDFRARLVALAADMKKTRGLTANVAAEVEGFVVKGLNAEQSYNEVTGFELISTGGYFHSLPLAPLKNFIDTAAEAQRAMGFRNEKDHPEVAPSQFELNFSHAGVVRACDLVQLYKLVCRQVAANMGMTATFLPKPVSGVNGSGMHLNLSFSKGGRNIFHEAKGKDGLSKAAWEVVSRLLNHAQELSLILNPSVNAYRRLDPHFEAPNQIKVSSVDRGAMIRIPAGNDRSARLEIRSVAPDANPYLALYALLRTALDGEPLTKDEGKRDRMRYLPGNIYDALRLFRASEFMREILGTAPQEKYALHKQAAADRSPRELGTIVKTSEVLFHHDVTTQMLWHKF